MKIKKEKMRWFFYRIIKMKKKKILEIKSLSMLIWIILLIIKWAHQKVKIKIIK